MATATDVQAAIETKLDALTPSITRTPNVDLSPDHDAIAKGDTVYQLAVTPIGFEVIQSNDVHERIDVRVWVKHHLADPIIERTYTEVTWYTIVEQLIAHSFWSALADVYEIESHAEASLLERKGNIIEGLVQVIIRLVPE